VRFTPFNEIFWWVKGVSTIVLNRLLSTQSEGSMDSSFHVRSVLSEELTELTALSAAVYSATFGSSMSQEDLAADLRSRSEGYFRDALLRDVILVATTGSSLLGFAQFGDYHGEQGIAGDQRLRKLYVRVDCHRMGIGKALMEACLKLDRARKSRAVFLTVFEENVSAVAFYRRYGFLEVGKVDVIVEGVNIGEDLLMCRLSSARVIEPKRQVATWDCGLTCVAMLCDKTPKVMMRDFEGKTGSRSVWTIDILLLLQEKKTSGRIPRYYTRVLDVPLSHGDLSYYAATFLQDRARVLPLLKNECAHEREFSTDELADALTLQGCVAIVLVDKSTLNQTEFKGYLGHYILVFDWRDGKFWYFDPDTTSDEPRCVDREQLDAARRKDGTDMDVIVL
jgi:ribosomal protein S18 acetylase RimI-like enzyme